MTSIFKIKISDNESIVLLNKSHFLWSEISTSKRQWARRNSCNTTWLLLELFTSYCICGEREEIYLRTLLPGQQVIKMVRKGGNWPTLSVCCPKSKNHHCQLLQSRNVQELAWKRRVCQKVYQNWPTHSLELKASLNLLLMTWTLPAGSVKGRKVNYITVCTNKQVNRYQMSLKEKCAMP